MSLFNTFDICGSGMTAERFRLDIISNNIANVNTTHRTDGQVGPYRRKMVNFAPRANDGVQFVLPLDRQAPIEERARGVRVTGVTEDRSDFRLEYDPGNPDANAEGYVAKPNVNVMTEMVDMITASRAYEANATVLREAKNMMLKALQIGK
ncbi:MAG TPA: flagellar basal body rod protein FlgC [bacterium]|nr:flagellar basal body rod protein FlgC [bacterium]